MTKDREEMSSTRIWRIISIIGGLTYLLSLPLGNYPGRPLLKAIGIGAMAVMTLREARRNGWPAGRVLLGAALTFSCLGDILLALRIERSFLYGLSAFLVAHIIYIALFTRSWRRPLRPGAGRLAATAAVLIFSILFAGWLSSSLGGLALPVTIYICAITLMVVSSLWAGFSTQQVALGAVLFMISDSIIAIEKFKMDVPWSDYLIWATYYLGQYGIAFGYPGGDDTRENVTTNEAGGTGRR